MRAGGLGARGLGAHLTVATVVRMVLAAAISLFLFYPSLLGPVLPVRVLAIGLGMCAIALEVMLGTRRRSVRIWTVVGVAAATALAMAAIELIARAAEDRMLAVNATHLLVLAPLYGVWGALLVRRGVSRATALTFVAVAAVTAVLACVESFLDVSILGRQLEFLTSQREGPTRALLGAEHVLVLGALLAVAVPLAALLRRTWWRVGVTLVLVAGCWATGSRAAAVLCVAVAVLQAVPVVVRVIQRHARWILVALAAGVAVLAGLSLFVWTPYIAGETGVEYSANYRFASYALLPQILFARPLGYVLQSVPPEVWMMSSDLRGPVDLARSADSEIVFAVFTLGWVGLALYLATFVVGVLALRRRTALGFATLTFSALGIIMSLHGWDAASVLWYALIGACCATVFPRADGRSEATVRQDADVDDRHGEQETQKEG